MDIEPAIDKALAEMPKDFMIRPFIEENKAEVKSMFTSEYDEAEVMELFKEEGREEGRLEGRLEGIEKGISLFILDKLNDHVSFDVIKERLVNLYGIKPDEADAYIGKYAV